MSYASDYLRWQGHNFKLLSKDENGVGHWECRNCKVKATVPKVLGCPEYPPTPLSLEREFQDLSCGEIVVRHVTEL